MPGLGWLRQAGRVLFRSENAVSRLLATLATRAESWMHLQMAAAEDWILMARQSRSICAAERPSVNQ